MATVEDVRKYWQEHPLLSYELARPGSKEFFDAFDWVKREDVEAFAQDFWRFDQFDSIECIVTANRDPLFKPILDRIREGQSSLIW